MTEDVFWFDGDVMACSHLLQDPRSRAAELSFVCRHQEPHASEAHTHCPSGFCPFCSAALRWSDLVCI